MTEATHDRVALLERAIVDATSSHWKSVGKALLLSSLGQQLMRQGFDLKTELRGQKLVPFLESRMSTQVTVLISPFDKLVVGVVPKGEEAKTEIRKMFAAPGDTSDRTTFDRRVWAAFSRTIPDDHARLLQLDPEINFVDVPSEKVKEFGLPIVPADLVIPPESKPSSIRNAEMQRNIRSWLEQNSIPIEKATAKATEVGRTSEQSSSLLLELMSMLDRREQERVSLPLDIVAKLLSKTSKRP